METNKHPKPDENAVRCGKTLAVYATDAPRSFANEKVDKGEKVRSAEWLTVGYPLISPIP
jgi:hypothetical protein